MSLFRDGTSSRAALSLGRRAGLWSATWTGRRLDMVTYVSAAEWKVDLQQLADAIGTVSAERDAIKLDSDQLKAYFLEIETDWKGPAGNSFITLQTAFNSSMDELTTLLDDIVERMQTVHTNYVEAETDNTN